MDPTAKNALTKRRARCVREANEMATVPFRKLVGMLLYLMSPLACSTQVHERAI